MSLIRTSLALLVLSLVVTFGSVNSTAQEKTPLPRDVKELMDYREENKEERMAWWREARFGMFIHWGIYSVPAGVYEGKEVPGIGEWIMLRAQIPVDVYAGYAKEFNPVKYDPDAWVRLAKEAGMKYIVITSKHHDGFALFDSAVTDYDVVDATPYKKDLLKPLAEACRKHGIKLGFYYSQAQDWHHPGGSKSGDSIGWDDKQSGDMDDYIRTIARPQAEELLTAYPDLSIFWWDTPRGMNRERALALLPALKHNPDIVTNNRLGGGFRGDTQTPEQHIPATGFKDRDFEVCMTMNDTWGYKSHDHNWKSSASLIKKLVDIASKGGNYLLNVGPTAEGEIPSPSIERLQDVGAWMRVHSESIYGTTASPFSYLPWGRCTAKLTDAENILYLHVFDWPSDQSLVIPKLANDVISVELLASGKSLSAERAGEDVRIRVPVQAPDAVCSVVKLTIKGTPRIGYLFPVQQANGSIRIPAQRMLLHKRIYNADLQVRTETIDEVQTVTNWHSHRDNLECVFKVKAPGEFEAVVDMKGDRPTKLKVTGQPGSNLVCELKPSKDFTTQTLGAIRLPTSGEYRLSLKPADSNWKPIEIRSLQLKRKMEKVDQ